MSFCYSFIFLWLNELYWDYIHSEQYVKVGEENGVRFGIALRHILPASMNHQQHDILITSQGVDEGVGGVMGIQTNVATDWCLA